MQMPKVVHIIDHFGLGGAQRLIQTIASQRENIFVLPIRLKKKMQLELSDDKFLLQPRSNLLAQLFQLLSVPGLIRKNKIEVVHCHLSMGWLLGILLWLILKKNKRMRFIFHEHDSARIKQWYYPIFLFFFRKAGPIIVVSRHVQQKLIRRGIPSHEIYILQNCIDVPRFEKIAQSKPLPSSDFDPKALKTIGFAGRLSPVKGWQYIVPVARNLHGLNFQLLVAGSGQAAKQLEKQIQENGLEKEVKMLGVVNQMPDFYRQLDLLMFPSVEEAFGLVIIEAQASGIPVVSFDIEAAQEVGQNDSVLLVERGNVAQMAESIQKILENPSEAEALRQRGFNNARLYSIDNYLKRLESIYRALYE